MTMPSDSDLAAFVAASAIMLRLELDEQALEAVLDAMRGVANQAALVLEYPNPPAAP